MEPLGLFWAVLGFKRRESENLPRTIGTSLTSLAWAVGPDFASLGPPGKPLGPGCTVVRNFIKIRTTAQPPRPLGLSWGPFGPSWSVLEAFGCLGAILGAFWGPLGSIFGPSVNSLGAALGPSWAVLRRRRFFHEKETSAQNSAALDLVVDSGFLDAWFTSSPHLLQSTSSSLRSHSPSPHPFSFLAPSLLPLLRRMSKRGGARGGGGGRGAHAPPSEGLCRFRLPSSSVGPTVDDDIVFSTARRKAAGA